MREFLESIALGYDGVVQKIEFISDKRATVIISARVEGDDSNWVNVAFHLDELREFNVERRSTATFIVLSDGIAYLFKNNIHYIDFSPNGDVEEEIDDENEFRRSRLYFAADKITYEVLPYRKDY